MITKRASSLIEYTMIAAIASAVLIGMSTYIKRGTQGDVKDLTDSWISNKQETEITTGAVTSKTHTIDQLNYMKQDTFTGGATNLELQQTRLVEAESSVEDRKPFDTASFTPASAGNFTAPARSDDVDHSPHHDDRAPDIEQLLNENEIKLLEIEKADALTEIERIKNLPNDFKKRGEELINSSNHMHCDDDEDGYYECLDGKYSTQIEGQWLLTRAGDYQARIDYFIDELAKIDSEIAMLNSNNRLGAWQDMLIRWDNGISWLNSEITGFQARKVEREHLSWDYRWYPFTSNIIGQEIREMDNEIGLFSAEIEALKTKSDSIKAKIDGGTT